MERRILQGTGRASESERSGSVLAIPWFVVVEILPIAALSQDSFAWAPNVSYKARTSAHGGGGQVFWPMLHERADDCPYLAACGDAESPWATTLRVTVTVTTDGTRPASLDARAS